MLCVTNRIVVPVSCQILRSSSFKVSRVISSRAPNGSSINKMRGSETSARAIATRWRMPPDSSCGSACSRPARPTSRRSSSGRPCPTRLRLRGPTSSGSRTFSRAERHGSRVASWNTKPSSRLSRALSGDPPSTVTEPCVGATRSATNLSRVDLPQPDGPRRLTNPPGGTCSATFSSATTEPRSLVNRTVEPSSLTADTAARLVMAQRPPGLSADLGARRRARFEHGVGHHVADLRRLTLELLKVVVDLDLLFPDARLHRAPALDRRGLGEAEAQHGLDRIELGVAVEIRVGLHQEIDRLLGILVRVEPPLRRRARESGEHVAVLLTRHVGRVAQVRVELDAGDPAPHDDTLGAEGPQRAHVREPAGDRIDLARDERQHVAAHDHDLDVGLLDLVLREERAQQDPRGALRADLLADHVLRRTDRLLRQREVRERMLLIPDREAFDRKPAGACEHQGRARREIAGLS